MCPSKRWQTARLSVRLVLRPVKPAFILLSFIFRKNTKSEAYFTSHRYILRQKALPLFPWLTVQVQGTEARMLDAGARATPNLPGPFPRRRCLTKLLKRNRPFEQVASETEYPCFSTGNSRQSSLHMREKKICLYRFQIRNGRSPDIAISTLRVSNENRVSLGACLRQMYKFIFSPLHLSKMLRVTRCLVDASFI